MLQGAAPAPSPPTIVDVVLFDDGTNDMFKATVFEEVFIVATGTNDVFAFTTTCTVLAVSIVEEFVSIVDERNDDDTFADFVVCIIVDEFFVSTVVVVAAAADDDDDDGTKNIMSFSVLVSFVDEFVVVIVETSVVIVEFITSTRFQRCCGRCTNERSNTTTIAVATSGSFHLMLYEKDPVVSLSLLVLSLL